MRHFSRKPIRVSEFNKALRTGHWIEYATLEEAIQACEFKAKRFRKFVCWEVYGPDDKKIAEIYGQH